MPILDSQQSYTFSKIFELKIQPKDLAQELGYTLKRDWLNLPQYVGKLDRLEERKSRIKEVLPYVDLANEQTRREVLIAPIVLDLIHYTQSEVRIEYPIKVNQQLQGYFDYLIESQNNLIIIEAKQEDLNYGLTQLVAEMIALAQFKNAANPFIGAVTTGNIWQFCRLFPTQKYIEQGLNLYRVPDDLDPLLHILVQALLL